MNTNQDQNNLPQQSPTGEEFGRVLLIGEPLLRRQAKAVSSWSATSSYCQMMIEKLWQLKGAGLAANQLGIDLQIIVVEVRKNELFPDRPESPTYLLLNPSIVAHSEEITEDWELCMSVPDLLGMVPRYQSIEVEYDDLAGAKQHLHLDGYVARIVQHEIDHLNGVFYLDRMKTMQSLTTRRNYLNYVRRKG